MISQWSLKHLVSVQGHIYFFIDFCNNIYIYIEILFLSGTLLIITIITQYLIGNRILLAFL